MKKKNYFTPLLVATLMAGAGAGVAGFASAQTASSSVSVPSTTLDRSPTNVSPGQHRGGHAPLGNDGNITAISGSTITMSEESDEGGASYTVDASKATFLKDGAPATIADLKVGDKVFIKGTVTGTTVAATEVSLGRPQHQGRGSRAPNSSTQLPVTQ